jgi:hypothetical protein
MASRLTEVPRVTGQTAHIRITWTFFAPGGGVAFETEQEGVLKLASGDVVLRGVVTDGDHLGARTQDRGHPTDASGSYAGTMRVLP